MTLLFAAVGATVAAVFELSVGPYLRIAGAQPHFVLFLGVVVTVAVGLEAGLAWGFLGGLVLDVLAQRPLGSTAFAMLLAVGVAAVLGRASSGVRPLIPIPATFVLSLLYSMTLFLAFNALRATIPVADPVAAILPGAFFDTFLAALVGPLAVTIHDRRLDEERVDW
jgi:rod shape-determining protein MreD